MARVIISIDKGKIAEVFEQVRDKTDDMTPLMKEFRAIGIAAINERFRKEGPGWQEHSEATIARRGEGAPILRDKARLVGSITGEGPDSISRVTKNSIELGSTVKYAKIHNFGGTIEIKPRKAKKGAKKHRTGVTKIVMPRRRFLPNEAELMPDLLAAAEDYLEELIDAQ